VKFGEEYKQSLHADRRHLSSAITIRTVQSRLWSGQCRDAVLSFAFLAMTMIHSSFKSKKRAGRVLEPPRGKSRYAHQGRRVVEGQRVMQAASDIFLGWARTTGTTITFVSSAI